MSIFTSLLNNLPEVKPPEQKRLPFNIKLKWTLLILVSYFVLGIIPLFGLGENALQQFEAFSIILGAEFGSLISLGIGPIVTASIVLQLLTGSGLLKIDLTTHEGKKTFQGLQKILTIFFILFEASIYVLMGGLAPESTLAPGQYRLMQMVLIVQLFFGGLLILYMDEVVSKWGFGSGVSLFIAAGVSARIFVAAFSPLNTLGDLAFGSGQAPVGKVWVLFQSLAGGNMQSAILALSAIAATIIVFAMAVYAQTMKVEIPLSFGRIRGHGIRWPLNFIYTSNIPVILVAALIANVQLWARLVQNRVGEATSGFFYFISKHMLGQFAPGTNAPESGLVFWTNAPRLVEVAITNISAFLHSPILLQSLTYILFMMAGSVLFSLFWVQTAGMDAKTQAKNIMASGLQVPGFRRDQRVLETILNRYIGPLTILGALAVGFLAASADLLGALTSGTGILLTVMIIYRLYEEIAQQHMMDMHPMLRKVMEG